MYNDIVEGSKKTVFFPKNYFAEDNHYEGDLYFTGEVEYYTKAVRIGCFRSSAISCGGTADRRHVTQTFYGGPFGYTRSGYVERRRFNGPEIIYLTPDSLPTPRQYHGRLKPNYYWQARRFDFPTAVLGAFDFPNVSSKARRLRNVQEDKGSDHKYKKSQAKPKAVI